eukprot:GHRQ01027245.1.p2 GENE.GHRQ01027245.1~~GHRQ01027245.1.p2  ORF type:complete len:196 (-),score=39.09 GHRQ01027245.1:111-698(-)
MQAKQLLQQRFSGMEVVGSTYPVPATKQALAQGLGLAQMVGFGFVIFGDKLFQFMGYAAPPELYVQHVAGNRVGVGVGIWFLGNFLQNQLLSTGAFEVFYDGTLVRLWMECQFAACSRPWQPDVKLVAAVWFCDLAAQLGVAAKACTSEDMNGIRAAATAQESTLSMCRNGQNVCAQDTYLMHAYIYVCGFRPAA